mgnify:CR=1 FL=1
MMQFTGNTMPAHDPGCTARLLRLRAESLLKTAATLLNGEGRTPVEEQDLALELSKEAICLLAQVRGLQSKH